MKLLRTRYLKSRGQQNIDEHEYPMILEKRAKKSIEKKKILIVKTLK